MANKIKASRVRVNDTEFQFTHGRKPSGRGGWAFRFGSKDAPAEFIHGDKLFSEARREAVKMASERGVEDVFVAT